MFETYEDSIYKILKSTCVNNMSAHILTFDMENYKQLYIKMITASN